MTQSASDSYRNILRYQGQDYRFAPTYIRKRDPISPTNQSPDIKPPEQQGYYPVTSLWTNVAENRVWILVNIQNNLANWVLISAGGGGGGIQSLTTPNVTVFPNGAGDISFNSSDNSIAIVGNAGTFSIDLSASPVLNLLDFHLVQQNTDVFPAGSIVNFDSSDTSVAITRTNGNTINFSVPGAMNTFLGLRAATNATNVDPDPAVGVLQNRILIASSSTTVNVNGNAGTHTVDLDVPGAIKKYLTDFDATGTISPGEVVPTANIVKIKGNLNLPGIGTQGIATQSGSETGFAPFDVVYIKYADGKITTVDTSTTTVFALAIDDNSSFTVSASFTCYEPLNGKSFGGRLLAIGRKVGGVCTITSKLENVSGGDPSLNTCVCNAVGSGGNLKIQVKGVAGKTLNWHVIMPWIAVAI